MRNGCPTPFFALLTGRAGIDPAILGSKVRLNELQQTARGWNLLQVGLVVSSERGLCVFRGWSLSGGGECVFELLPEERRCDEASLTVDDDLDAVTFAAAEL